MKKPISFLFSVVLTILLLGSPTSGLAEDGTENTLSGFSNVYLDVWAEYDDELGLGGNLLLIILEGYVSTNGSPEENPVDVSFMVPGNVEMYSAGYMDSSGIYHRGYDYDGPPKREDSGIPGWDIITITMESDHFIIEYYDPDIITGNNNNKSLSYEFRWLYPIIHLSVLVQAPEGVSKLEVEPEGQANTYEDYKSYYYQFQNLPFSNLDAQEPIKFEISYSFGGGANPLLITGIIIGVFAIVTVVYFMSQKSGSSARAERRRQLKSGSTRETSVSARSDTPAKYCRHCGAKLDRPSKFCPTCGGSL